MGLLNRRGQIYFAGAVALVLTVGVLTLNLSPGPHDMGEDGGVVAFMAFAEWALLSRASSR
ncbi:hypothetical protein [Nocardioides sp.]|uniref:hypothetical protein n=1 Tax=Nocardioides sp. TaxID=35761 RepID=UPI0031FE5EC7|nr:hypothetical protein [Nocardioides sp.]